MDGLLPRPFRAFPQITIALNLTAPISPDIVKDNIVLIKMRKRMNRFQAETLNRPIRKDFGYGPIETVSYKIQKGIHAFGQRSNEVSSSAAQPSSQSVN